jgi:hypothetical protein
MFPQSSKTLDDVVAELRSQGVTINLDNATNKTWYVKGDGIYVGYVVTSDELIALKRENRLTLEGVKSLG